jgi:hypothetical protein
VSVTGVPFSRTDRRYSRSRTSSSDGTVRAARNPSTQLKSKPDGSGIGVIPTKHALGESSSDFRQPSRGLGSGSHRNWQMKLIVCSLPFPQLFFSPVETSPFNLPVFVLISS